MEKINIIVPLSEHDIESFYERIVYGDTEYIMWTFDAEDAEITVNVHFKKEE